VNARWKPVLYAVLALAMVWLLAWGGYALARSHRMTADRVRAYLHSVDFAHLQGGARVKALRELARMMNALSYEERRTARLDQEWSRWFEAMTEAEKGEFIEATMPTGFKQMIGAFEQLPAQQRKRTIENAMRRLAQARDQDDGSDPTQDQGTNRPPVVSQETLRRVTAVGLKTFYSESSAQTKAEAAPLLEELQRTMESGAMLHQR